MSRGISRRPKRLNYFPARAEATDLLQQLTWVAQSAELGVTVLNSWILSHNYYLQQRSIFNYIYMGSTSWFMSSIVVFFLINLFVITFQNNNTTCPFLHVAHFIVACGPVSYWYDLIYIYIYICCSLYLMHEREGLYIYISSSKFVLASWSISSSIWVGDCVLLFVVFAGEMYTTQQ